MNPWGLLILGLGVLLIIMGVTGSYTKVRAAITGAVSGSSSSSPSTGGSGANAARTASAVTTPAAGTVQVA